MTGGPYDSGPCALDLHTWDETSRTSKEVTLKSKSQWSDNSRLAVLKDAGGRYQQEIMRRKSSLEFDSVVRQRVADIARISIGIGLVLSFFLPMGIYFYHEGDTSDHPLHGFLVITSYLGVVIGVIMIFYYKLPFFSDFHFPKFLKISIVLILGFDWIVNIFILDGGILVDYWHHHMMGGEGSDLDTEFYNGSIFFIITSFALFSLRLFHTKREVSVFTFLLFSLIVFFFSLALRFLMLTAYYP